MMLALSVVVVVVVNVAAAPIAVVRTCDGHCHVAVGDDYDDNGAVVVDVVDDDGAS